MKKLKVVTIVGTRPEIIRLSMLIPKLDQYTDHVFVHTGQNSDPKLNEVFFQDLGLRQPDVYLNVDTSSMGAVMGDTIKKSEAVLLREKPDAVMILGDTNSAIAAVVAERMHIPVYHMEAGNRSFDNNVPEELNRKMVDHVSTFNLPYNTISMGNLVREGIHPRYICRTGSPIPEIYERYRSEIGRSKILSRLGLAPKRYILVSMHRQENVDFPSRLNEMLHALEALGEKYKMPVLVSTHPRTRSRLTDLQLTSSRWIQFHEPFGYLDYNQLQLNAFCVVSDSGTISEESSALQFPGVTFRDSTERTESFEAGGTTLSGLSVDGLLGAVEWQVERYQNGNQPIPEGYGSTNFSNIVLNFLLSTARQAASWKNFHPDLG